MTRTQSALTALIAILALSGLALGATLEIEPTTHLEPGETGTYVVTYNDSSGNESNVTSDASVNMSSDNLTADDGKLEAASGDYAELVTINASYDGETTDNETVAVGNATMANFDILPLWPSIQAIGTSSTLFIIAIATMLSVLISRLMIRGSSAARTGGTSPSIIIFELILIMGWVAGMVHSAVVILSMVSGVWAILMAARNDV